MICYNIAGSITVGYEFDLYDTTETVGSVEICAVIIESPSGVAPREFTVSSTTHNGTAGIYVLLNLSH